MAPCETKPITSTSTVWLRTLGIFDLSEHDHEVEIATKAGGRKCRLLCHRFDEVCDKARDKGQTGGGLKLVPFGSALGFKSFSKWPPLFLPRTH